MKKILLLFLALFLCTACTPRPAEKEAFSWKVDVQAEGVYALSFDEAIDRRLHGGLAVSVDPDMTKPFPAGKTVRASIPDAILEEGWQTAGGTVGFIVTVITENGAAHPIPALYDWPMEPDRIPYFTLTGSAEEGFTLTPKDADVTVTPVEDLPASFW